jgi:hypothetical protein
MAIPSERIASIAEDYRYCYGVRPGGRDAHEHLCGILFGSSMNDGLTKQASDFLLGLARGQYDKELAEADEALTAIGLPWAIMAREALHAFVIINRATAPGEVQPDVF